MNNMKKWIADNQRLQTFAQSKLVEARMLKKPCAICGGSLGDHYNAMAIRDNDDTLYAAIVCRTCKSISQNNPSDEAIKQLAIRQWGTAR